MTLLSRHPLSAAWPDMSPEELQALQDDIEVNGQVMPILVHNGQVLDGWHRYRACVNLMIEPVLQEIPDEEDLGALSHSLNDTRRHATLSQRAFAKAERVRIQGGWAGKGAHGKSAAAADLGVSVKQAASEAGVAERTMAAAKAVEEKAVEEVKQAVRQGNVTVEKAEKIAKLPPKEQVEALRKPRPPKAPKKAASPKAEKLAKPEPKPAALDGIDLNDEALAVNPIKEWERTQAELEQAQKLILSIEATDPRAEALKWRQIADVSQRRQAELQEIAHKRDKDLQWYSGQLKRIGRAVGVDDPTKIAAAVEAVMRAQKASA